MILHDILGENLGLRKVIGGHFESHDLEEGQRSHDFDCGMKLLCIPHVPVKFGGNTLDIAGDN